MGLLKDGYQTLLLFSEIAAKKYKVISLTPPPVDGRGPIDQTNMESIIFTQKSAKVLLDIGNFTAVIAYDSQNYQLSNPDALGFQVNINQEISLTFPDGSAVVFWGYINAFRPGEHAEGQRPTATLEMVVTNEDNDGNQTAPDWFAP